MEKFLLLVRRYLGATFKVMEGSAWDEEVVKDNLELLAEVPLNVQEVRIPNGMRFHVIDIYVDELERSGVLEEEGKDILVEKLLEPVRNLAKGSPTKPVRIKAKEALKDERLPGNKKSEGEETEVAKEDDTWGGIEG